LSAALVNAAEDFLNFSSDYPASVAHPSALGSHPRWPHFVFGVVAILLALNVTGWRFIATRTG
jgi:hypothetical protein